MSRPYRRSRRSAHRRGLTLIEMLVATAITLLMMAAVVNLFANLTGSIRNRRAVIELSGQLRQARQRLSLDFAGATCPAVPWQRPGDDVGYLEIIEGAYSDSYPSALVDGNTGNGEVDLATSILPRNNLVRDYDNSNSVDDDDATVHNSNIQSLTPGGIGDYDDILALTVRSDDEPFVAQVNGNRVESRLAEVIWFAVENPANGLLGEPGMRRIYRRALVIAPWLDPIDGPPDSAWFFQRYDVSARYDVTKGKWIPNTLGDLTRRENRCYRQSGDGPISPFPHMLATGGAGYSDDTTVKITRTTLDTQNADARATALVDQGSVIGYVITNGGLYDDLPSAVVEGPGLEATARPVLAQTSKNPDQWKVAQITFGPAPLSIHRLPTSGGGSFLVDRTGDDLMLSDALAFDLRVYDPGAPIYRQPLAAGANPNDPAVFVQPGDPYWGFIAQQRSALDVDAYGAYVDMGWTHLYPDITNLPTRPSFPKPIFDVPKQAGWNPRFDPRNSPVYPFRWPAEYDTWSLHYESDGIDQDGLGGVDQGSNGLDDDGNDGPDDAAERETAPPYDVPLRGVQVRLRVYERDARQVRETSVTRSLVP